MSLNPISVKLGTFYSRKKTHKSNKLSTTCHTFVN